MMFLKNRSEAGESLLVFIIFSHTHASSQTKLSNLTLAFSLSSEPCMPNDAAPLSYSRSAISCRRATTESRASRAITRCRGRLIARSRS
ncbi:hypothetical protein BC938DRAFT_476623 [Jimgerdemannia flammicorona]|uniref:Uncharacterized protein n=1 Tax=Jimgerdemannia flammicorona TaxID=994334 RepID=A0A433PFJ3_9FUNG|nr:hypothetical protein BC938DRAFT_476623 [Jimgerdemannia flammicorona]